MHSEKRTKCGRRPSSCRSEWSTGSARAVHRPTVQSMQPGATMPQQLQAKWGHNSYQIVLDDGKMQYFAERTLSFRWQHDPHFTENAKVKFTLNGDKLTVVDDAGKEFKMQLTKRRLKE